MSVEGAEAERLGEVVVADAVEEEMKNGRTMIKGKCPACGVVVFKILDGKTHEGCAVSDLVDPSDPTGMPS